jgi:hypothetical protein
MKLWLRGTVVEHSSHNPNVKGSIPAISMEEIKLDHAIDASSLQKTE